MRAREVIFNLKTRNFVWARKFVYSDWYQSSTNNEKYVRVHIKNDTGGKSVLQTKLWIGTALVSKSRRGE